MKAKANKQLQLEFIKSHGTAVIPRSPPNTVVLGINQSGTRTAKYSGVQKLVLKRPSFWLSLQEIVQYRVLYMHDENDHEGVCA